MRRLSNARAKPVGEFTDFPVIFEFGSLTTPTGATVTSPVATALDTDVANFRVQANDSELQIRDVTYTVRDLQPDGAGFTLLVLEAC